MKIKLVYVWLCILTGLYFFWPMVESESLRYMIYDLDCQVKEAIYLLHLKDPPPENLQWEKVGVWMKKKNQDDWDMPRTDFRCINPTTYHPNKCGRARTGENCEIEI